MKRSFFRQIAPLLISLVIMGGLSLLVRRFETQMPQPFNRLLVEALPEIPNLEGWPAPFLKRLEAAHGRLGDKETQRDALVELAYLYHANGFLVQAQSCYLGLESFESENALWPYLLGVIKSNSRDKRVVAEHFVRSLQLDPTNSLAYLRLGHAYREGGMLDEAAKAYRYRLIGSPNDAWAMASFGQVSLYAGRNAEAVDWLEKARSVDPELELIYDLLSEAYMELGDVAASRTVRLDGEGRTLSSTLADERLAFLQDYCFDAARLVVFARERRLAGEPEAALDLLQRAVNLDAQNADAMAEIGEIVRELELNAGR